MQIEYSTSDTLARYLDVAATSLKLTAANMANVDTPGYRAMGINFDAEMRNAMRELDGGVASTSVEVKPEEGMVARPDGNNVSMDRESLQLAEAQLKFKTGIALLRTQFQMVTDAIRADSK